MTSRATQSSLKRIGSRAPLTVQQCWLPFIRATSPPPHEGFDRGCRDVGYWAPARSITDAARVRFSSRSSFLRVALIHSKSRAPRDRSSSFSFSLSSSSLFIPCLFSDHVSSSTTSIKNSSLFLSILKKLHLKTLLSASLP